MQILPTAPTNPLLQNALPIYSSEPTPPEPPKEPAQPAKPRERMYIYSSREYISGVGNREYYGVLGHPEAGTFVNEDLARNWISTQGTAPWGQSEQRSFEIEYDTYASNKQDYLKSNFGGIVTPLELAPIGSHVQTETKASLDAKAAFLQNKDAFGNPTAQWASKETFQKAATETMMYRNVPEVKGNLVSNPSHDLIPTSEPTFTQPVPDPLPIPPPQTKYDAKYGQMVKSQEQKEAEKLQGKPDVIFDPKYGMMVKEDKINLLNELQKRESRPTEISSFSKSFYEGTQRVGRVISGWEETADIGAKKIEGRLPADMKDVYDVTYQFGKGLFLEAPKGAVETAGMIPGGVEVISKQPAILPAAVVFGVASMAASAKKELKENPASFIGAQIGTAVIFEEIGGVKRKISEAIKFSGKEYIPPNRLIEPQVLSGKETFPLSPKGTTGAQLQEEFLTSQYKLPRITSEFWDDIGGFHATPQRFSKVTETNVGTSESPGMYIAPSLSQYFLKLSPDELKLFGLGELSNPAAIYLKTLGIERPPIAVRYDLQKFNEFMMGKAEKGKAYISEQFEAGIKPEKEAIIPPETPIEQTAFRYYTVLEGKKVPILEYATKSKFNIKDDLNSMTIQDLSLRLSLEYEKYYSSGKPMFTPNSILGVGASTKYDNRIYNKVQEIKERSIYNVSSSDKRITEKYYGKFTDSKISQKYISSLKNMASEEQSNLFSKPDKTISSNLMRPGDLSTVSAYPTEKSISSDLISNPPYTPVPQEPRIKIPKLPKASDELEKAYKASKKKQKNFFRSPRRNPLPNMSDILGIPKKTKRSKK